MKILMLGNSASHWQRMFAERVIMPLGHKTYELTDRNNGFGLNLNRGKNVFLTPDLVPPLLMKIPKVRAAAILNNDIRALRKDGPYDVIINMFVSNSSLFCARALKGKNTKIIAYFCGSDILRLEGFNLFLMKQNLKHVDSIVFASEQVKNGFLKKCGSYVAIHENVIHLGVSVFDEIENIKKGRINSRDLLQIPESKITVCIGYNGNPSQQHIAVVDQLSKLSGEDKKKLHLILPMTYSGTEDYYRLVENRIKEEKMSYSIFRAYMNDAEMALLHSSVDVFINAQKTDGLSASVMESMYAGAILLNAKWLDYPEYNEWGLTYETFQNFEDLLPLIQKIIGNKIARTDINRNILQNKMSWKSTKDAWRQLL